MNILILLHLQLHDGWDQVSRFFVRFDTRKMVCQGAKTMLICLSHGPWPLLVPG